MTTNKTVVGGDVKTVTFTVPTRYGDHETVEISEPVPMRIPTGLQCLTALQLMERAGIAFQQCAPQLDFEKSAAPADTLYGAVFNGRMPVHDFDITHLIRTGMMRMRLDRNGFYSTSLRGLLLFVNMYNIKQTIGIFDGSLRDDIDDGPYTVTYFLSGGKKYISFDWYCNDVFLPAIVLAERIVGSS